jgi:hypothetical protein
MPLDVTGVAPVRRRDCYLKPLLRRWSAQERTPRRSEVWHPLIEAIDFVGFDVKCRTNADALIQFLLYMGPDSCFSQGAVEVGKGKKGASSSRETHPAFAIGSATSRNGGGQRGQRVSSDAWTRLFGTRQARGHPYVACIFGRASCEDQGKAYRESCLNFFVLYQCPALPSLTLGIFPPGRGRKREREARQEKRRKPADGQKRACYCSINSNLSSKGRR